MESTTELAAAATAGGENGPRITPGTAAEVGRVNFALARLIGLAAGSGPPNVFTTIARHRRVFRPWVRSAGALMPGGKLPRAESELLILRVAHNCGCEYEWHHHERLALTTGLSSQQVAAVREGATAAGWSARQALLLRAADELHERRTIGRSLWDELHAILSEVELIELCMLVGHYEMLAMTLNSLGVQPDRMSSEQPPRAARAIQALIARRRGGA